MRLGRCLLIVIAPHLMAGMAWGSGLATCVARRPAAVSDSGARPPEPLGRVVSFHASAITLRDALERFSATAGVRLTYSAEALPLDRTVCVALDSVSVREALEVLLDSAAAVPVAAGPDHIVLAPIRLTAAPPPMPQVTLDRIVVTGSAVGAAQKPLSLALSVVEGRELAQGSVGTLSQAVNAAVPGLWMWAQSPSSFVAQYGSVRGASSFGLSYPKVYIDGIEVANPLLIARLAPEAVDRIELIRGPQGAALYGADAISGVTNIVLRPEG
ncbi:MAG: TonB-dependent receptor plug domain-containing protein, partial [Gemmatimonadetes bacterium]|nr:TonB-dependent receptor plug domain-containing protein [Gemmatimonadota bacterium]